MVVMAFSSVNIILELYKRFNKTLAEQLGILQCAKYKYRVTILLAHPMF